MDPQADLHRSVFHIVGCCNGNRPDSGSGNRGSIPLPATKSVTIVDTISTTVIFYLFPFWGCFWKETRNISNIFGHKQIVCPDLMRPRSEKTRLCKMTIVIRI